MTVRAILAEKGTDVHTLAPGGTLLEATRTLGEHKVGALVVADANRKILGILSERDIVRAVADKGSSALEKKVDAVMTKNVTTCSEETTVTELMAMMTEGRFRHLPVADNGKLTGIISIGDVVKKRMAEIEREAEEIKAYIAAV